MHLIRHPQATPHKPQGQPTRGKTARNRLRRVDNFLLIYDSSLLRRKDGPYARAFFVDLGYGAQPITTLESATRFRRINPELPVLGIEIDNERVESGLPYVDERTFFRLGGFNLPLEAWPDGEKETVRLIRAFNVLRQYEESDVKEAYARLARYVLPDGLLIEGTSDPFGRVWVANLLRKQGVEQGAGWQKEALVFSTNFKTGFDPAQFQAVLPKNYIHRMVRMEPIYNFLQAWQKTTQETRAMQVWGIRQWFISSAQLLATRGYRINTRRKWLSRGWLIWQLDQTAD